MRWFVLAALVIATPRPVRADGVQPFYSVSFGAGYAHRNGVDDGAALLLRPELILAADSVHPAAGIGPYLELVSIRAPSELGDHATLAGGGITAVLYSRGGLAVAGSLGVDVVGLGRGWHPQLAASLFVGFRTSEIGAVDLPIGLRVEHRPGTDQLPATTIAALSVDVVGIALGVKAISALLDKAGRR